ncbi:MAG: helix-turn-helix domain-containing protein [Propionibacteriaceae bacterium]|nr:helix-turn-helix domain-containing protein [Propionibacteriaceae bacterium]
MTPQQADDSRRPDDAARDQSETMGIADAAKALTDALGVLTRSVGRGISDASLGTVAAALQGASEDLASASSKLTKASPQRGRSRSGKAERTRSELLAAAAQVFADKGYEGASVLDVAKEAGFTKGAFYANFASKEAVILELAERSIQAQLELLERAREQQIRLVDIMCAADCPDAQEGAAAGSDWLLSESPAGQALLGLEILTYAVRHPEAGESISEGNRRVHDAAVQFYAENHGRTTPTDEDRLAVFGAMAVQSMSQIYERIMPPEEIRPMQDALLRRLLQA